jgi:hypothetical protein
MLKDPAQGGTPVGFASGAGPGSVVGAGPGSVVGAGPGSVVGARPGQSDGAPPIGRLALRGRVARPRIALGQVSARIALTTLILGAFAVVAVAAADPSVLVPRSTQTFPDWESGPLHRLFGRVIANPRTLGLAFSGVMAAMLVAYGIVLSATRVLSMRTIVLCIVALHLVLLMSPPLQLTDLFNYLGYARLGAVHHLDPYTHVIKQELHDPVFRFSSWHGLSSPYGPLFTELTYVVAFLPLAAAYWTLKVLTVLLSLGFLALVWHCARKLGRDPRFALAFVAFNPIYLMYEIGGFHNDFFMLVPTMAAIALLLGRRERSAGGAVMLAVAVKFTAVLLVPFLLIAARSNRGRRRLLIGAALAAVPLLVLDLWLFGFSIANLSDQSTLLTDFSFPNLFGLLIGIGGGTPALLKLASVALVLFVALQIYRRREWLSSAGWSTLALILSLAWLVPWYVVWLLPLAALGTSARLRRATLALTVFLVFAFVPATGQFLSRHNINLLSSPVGQASTSRQDKLAQ